VKLFPSLLVALLLWAGALNAQPRLIDDEAAVDAVFAHVADRLELMPAVAAAKWLAGSAVSDPAREQALLDRSASAALAMGLAEQAVRELLQLQMRLARDAQQRLHAQWREGGCDSCAGAASLQQTRARLDALGAAQLRALYVAAPVLDDAGFQARFASRAEQRLRQLIPDAADRGQLLAALAAVQRTQQPGLARIRASGVLLIGTTGDYAPFSLEAGGLLEGSDIERGLALARNLFRRVGRNLFRRSRALIKALERRDKSRPTHRDKSRPTRRAQQVRVLLPNSRLRSGEWLYAPMIRMSMACSL
jgi:cyclohexadienyl dehydratase